MPDNITWNILGAGAIGCLWASALHSAGRQPRLLLREPASLQRYRAAGGVTLVRDGEAHTHAIDANCAAAVTAPLRQLLITTKAHQTLEALAPLATQLAPDATVVLLQNGLGVAEQLRQHYPGLRIYQASTTEGAYRSAPFRVVHAGRGSTVIGAAGNSERSQLAACAAGLSAPPLAVSVSDDIERILWRKLAVNCAINPLTAIHHCRNGELLERPEVLEELHAVVEEIVCLSKALGYSDWVEGMLDTVLGVAHATGANRSSMLQDLESGRLTEIDYISGHLCRLADAKSIDLPANRALLDQVHTLETLGGCR